MHYWFVGFFFLCWGSKKIMKEALKSHQNFSIMVYQCPGSKTCGGKPLTFIVFAFPRLTLPETEKHVENHSDFSITAGDTNQFLPRFSLL